MRRCFTPPSLLLVALLFFGCSEEPAQYPTGSAPSNLLQSVGPPSQFYTVHWAIENDWAVALEWIDTQTGLGTSVCVFDIAPHPEYPEAFFTPYGLAFDLDGTMYTLVNWFDGVQDHSMTRLAKVDRETCSLTYIGEPYPINMAGPEIDACGNVYATGFTVGPPETGGVPTYVWGDSYLYRIDKYTGEATRIGDTGHTEWMDLDFDSQGRLFVATRGTNRIDIFSPTYEYIESWEQFGRPNDVFIDEDDTMYVLDSESGDERNPGMRRGVYIGSAKDGTLSVFIPGHAEVSEEHGTIGEGVAVDAAGNIFVGEVSVSGMTMFMPMM